MQMENVTDVALVSKQSEMFKSFVNLSLTG